MMCASSRQFRLVLSRRRCTKGRFHQLPCLEFPRVCSGWTKGKPVSLFMFFFELWNKQSCLLLKQEGKNESMAMVTHRLSTKFNIEKLQLIEAEKQKIREQ